MTNKESLLALLGFQPGLNAAERTFLKVGLDPFDNYDPANDQLISLAAIPIVKTLLTTPNVTNTITGEVITYDRAKVLEWINELKNEAGLIKTSVSTIRAISW